MKKPLGHTIWFKVILTIFAFIPAYAQVPYDPQKTSDVVAAVLSRPLITSVTWLLPIFKALLLATVVLSMINSRVSRKLPLGYYACILMVVAAFQNAAHTAEYGFVFLTGNALIQLAVLAYCLLDVIRNKTVIKHENFNKRRLWIVPLMLLAFLMPYSADSGNFVHPSLTWNVLCNEAGVTYCMITPVVIGLLLFYSKGADKASLSVISYVGFLFGLLNMITWFVLQPENWWMGVLHLPLLIIAFYGLVIAYCEKATQKIETLYYE